MEIRNLHTFVQVAQLKSFSKAAKQLGYSQAAVTIQIQHLEEELSTRLFERFNKSITLTQEGVLFYTHAQEILQAVASAKTCMKSDNNPSGHLRIGTIESLCTSLFPSLITTYHTLYPNVTISVEAASPKQLIEQLYQNKLDIVYLLDQPIYDALLCATLLQEEDIVFVCSSKHPLAKNDICKIANLCKEKWILTEENESYRCDLSNYLLQHNLHIKPLLEVGNIDLIIALLKENFGISFLPKSVVLPYLQTKELLIPPVNDAKFTMYHQLLYHKNKWLTSPMKAFMQQF